MLNNCICSILPRQEIMLTFFCELDEVFCEGLLKRFVFRGRCAECHLEATKECQAVNHVE